MQILITFIAWVPYGVIDLQTDLNGESDEK